MTAATGEPQGNQWVGAECELAERHLESQKRLNVTEEDGEWEMDWVLEVLGGCFVYINPFIKKQKQTSNMDAINY